MTSLATGSALLSFNAETHTYTLPDGRVVPSVTTILKETGVAKNYDELSDRSKQAETNLHYRRALGTAVHADCHSWDDDDLDLDTVDAVKRPYVEAWATFRENTGLTPLTRERRVFHAGLFYCGTLDGIFARPGGGRVLIDIKLGDPFDAGANFQTAAYAAAYEYEHPEEGTIEDRWAVQLVPERRVPYIITPYTPAACWDDFFKFQSHVCTYHCGHARRKR